MNMVSKLLAGWGDLINTEVGAKYEWMGDVFGAIEIVMYILMGLVGAAGAIYAIYLGINLARAEEQGKRDDCKKHLITVFIAVAVTIVFVLFFNLLLPMIVKAIIGKGIDKNGNLLPKTMISALGSMLHINI